MEDTNHIITVLISLLSGGVAGSIVSYGLRRVGYMSCTVSEWRPQYLTEMINETGTGTRLEPHGPQEATHVDVSFLLDISNQREVHTSLRGVGIAAIGENNVIESQQPLYPDMASARTGGRESALTTIDLPPNCLHSRWYCGRFTATIAKHMASGSRIDLVGYYPDKSIFWYSIDPVRDGFSPMVPPYMEFPQHNPGT